MGIAPSDDQKKEQGESSPAKKGSSSKKRGGGVVLDPSKTARQVRIMSGDKRVYSTSSSDKTENESSTLSMNENAEARGKEGKEGKGGGKDLSGGVEGEGEGGLQGNDPADINARPFGNKGPTAADASLDNSKSFKFTRQTQSQTRTGARRATITTEHERVEPRQQSQSARSLQARPSLSQTHKANKARLAALDQPMYTVDPDRHEQQRQQRRAARREEKQKERERERERKRKWKRVASGSAVDVDHIANSDYTALNPRPQEQEEVEKEKGDVIDDIRLGGAAISIVDSESREGGDRSDTMKRMERGNGGGDRKRRKRQHIEQAGAEEQLAPEGAPLRSATGPLPAQVRQGAESVVEGDAQPEVVNASNVSGATGEVDGDIKSLSVNPAKNIRTARSDSIAHPYREASTSSSSRCTLVESTEIPDKQASASREAPSKGPSRDASTEEPLFATLPSELDPDIVSISDAPSADQAAVGVGKKSGNGAEGARHRPQPCAGRGPGSSTAIGLGSSATDGSARSLSEQALAVQPITGKHAFRWEYIRTAPTRLAYPEISEEERLKLPRHERELGADEAVLARRNVQRLIIIIVTRLRNGLYHTHEALQFLGETYFDKAWEDLRVPLRQGAMSLERTSWKGEFRRLIRSCGNIDSINAISVRKYHRAKNDAIERCTACEHHQVKYNSLRDVSYSGRYHGMTLAPKREKTADSETVTYGRDCLDSAMDAHELHHHIYRTMVRLQQVHFPSLADLSDEMRTAVCANVVDVEEVLALLGKAVCDKLVKDLYAVKAVTFRRYKRNIGDW